MGGDAEGDPTIRGGMEVLYSLLAAGRWVATGTAPIRGGNGAPCQRWVQDFVFKRTHLLAELAQRLGRLIRVKRAQLLEVDPVVAAIRESPWPGHS